MIVDKSTLLWMSILIISCICFGWFGHIMYNEIMGNRLVDGFYVEGVSRDTLDFIQSKEDVRGDWVSINVNHMTFPQAYKTCQHEVMHKVYSEIWAEMCEKNFDKCSEELTRIQENITNG